MDGSALLFVFFLCEKISFEPSDLVYLYNENPHPLLFFSFGKFFQSLTS